MRTLPLAFFLFALASASSASAGAPVDVPHVHAPPALTLHGAPRTAPKAVVEPSTTHAVVVARAPTKVNVSERMGPPDRGFDQQGTHMTAWGDVKTLPPQSEEKRLWRVANRLNPGFQKTGSDLHIDVQNPSTATRERHNNCVLASLSFEDSMRGTPTVALPHLASTHVTPEAVADMKVARGDNFADRYTGKEKDSVFYARQYPNAVFERADDYHVLAQRLSASGPGARMIFRATWETPDHQTGGHAINMVNEHGTVVVVDAQSGAVQTPDVYFKGATWSGFRYFVTAEGGPGKSVFADADAANAIVLKNGTTRGVN